MKRTTSVVPLTVLDNGVGFGGALDFGEDVLCRSCPDKGLGRLVARFQVLVDGGLEFGNTAEHAVADALLCQLAEPALDEIEPRRRRGNEVKVEAGVLRESRESRGQATTFRAMPRQRRPSWDAPCVSDSVCV